MASLNVCTVMQTDYRSVRCGASLKHLTGTYYHVDLSEQKRAAMLSYEGQSQDLVEVD